ncbi:MAG: hypothetical protein AAFR36_31810 [Bacteroidota bacterium]
MAYEELITEDRRKFDNNFREEFTLNRTGFLKLFFAGQWLDFDSTPRVHLRINGKADGYITNNARIGPNDVVAEGPDQTGFYVGRAESHNDMIFTIEATLSYVYAEAGFICHGISSFGYSGNSLGFHFQGNRIQAEGLKSISLEPAEGFMRGHARILFLPA